MSDELKLGLDALRETGYSAYACAIKELVTDLRAELAAATETIARQAETIAELERKMNPRQWTAEENRVWHRSIPDVMSAFAALRDAKGDA